MDLKNIAHRVAAQDGLSSGFIAEIAETIKQTVVSMAGDDAQMTAELSSIEGVEGATVEGPEHVTVQVAGVPEPLIFKIEISVKRIG